MKTSRAIFLIILVSFAVYAGSFKNDFVFDDVPYVAENHFIQNLANLPHLFSREYFDISKERTYRPVCTLSFFIDYALWKLDVRGWHLTNRLFHTANAVLLFLIVLILLKQKTPALVAALVFAVHPAQTEAVLGISFREDMLSLFFCLAAFLLYLVSTGYVKHEWKHKKTPLLLYILSVLLYIPGVYAKEMAISFTSVFMLSDVCFRPWKNNNIGRRFSKYMPAYMFVAASFIVLKFTALSNTSMPAEYPGGTVLTAMLTMSRGVIHYLGLLFYPVKLNVDYVFEASTSILEPAVLASLAIIGLIFYVTFRVFRKMKGVFFAVMVFFINLLPVSNIIPFGAIVAERYLYFAFVGFAIFAGIIADKLYNDSKWKQAVKILLLCVLALYSARTARRVKDWKNGFTLWNASMSRSPGSYTVHNNLGVAYKKQGNIDEALKEYRKSLELNPSFVRALNNIGYIYYEGGQYEAALVEYNKAVTINPKFTEGFTNIGLVYYAMGNYTKAVESYNKALEINSHEFKVYSNLIAAHAQLGQFDKAREAFNAGIKENAEFGDLYKNMGLVCKMTGDNMQTLIYWKQYLNKSPEAPDAGLIKAEIDRMSNTP